MKRYLTQEDSCKRKRHISDEELPPDIDKDIWYSLPDDIKAELRHQFRNSNTIDLTEPTNALFTVTSNTIDLTNQDILLLPSTPIGITDLNSVSSVSDAQKEFLSCSVISPTLLNNQKLSLPSNFDNNWVFSSLSNLEVTSVSSVSSSRNYELWKDDEFPPSVSSIDGIDLPATHVSNQNQTPICKCGVKSRLLKVRKENQNQGRSFFSCSKPSNKCSFFLWAQPGHLQKDVDIKWARLTTDLGYRIVLSDGFKAEHVCQGSVGDCWFLSALAVVSERQDLIERILVTKTMSKNGKYETKLFIDGSWKIITIDDYFPLKSKWEEKKGRESKLPDGLPLMFCKSTQKQIWAPLIEKAYAKAHGSYKAISGGWIHEALFDLTSFPTETISFASAQFDSELFWTRLLSFHQLEFLMGASCPLSGEGLVGNHAYSILEVRELIDFNVGRQKTLHEYFNPEIGNAIIAKENFEKGRNECLRLLKIRNPWGVKEWKGSFSTGSVEWTKELRLVLNQEEDKDDGTFWMDYHNFLQRFHEVDVCFAYKSAYSLNIETYIPPSFSIPFEKIEIQLLEPTWLHISICQKTKRGKENERFYYSDISIAIFKMEKLKDATFHCTLEDIRLFGPSRVSHFDVLLGSAKGDNTYILIPFSIERELACCEELSPGIRIVGAGGKVEKGKKSPKVEFSLRFMSKVTIMSREIPLKGNDNLVWGSLQKIAWDDSLIKRNILGSPIITMDRIFSKDERGELRIRLIESPGICLAVAMNTLLSNFDVCVNMRCAINTYCSTLPSSWKTILSSSVVIIGVCIFPSCESVSGHQIVSIEDVQIRPAKSLHVNEKSKGLFGCYEFT